MIFNSVSFGIFFPLAVIIYFLIPASVPRLRIAWLTLAGYYFYMCQGAAYAPLLLFTTLITYFFALFLKKNRVLLVLSLVCTLSILFVFKCSTWTGFNLLLPVGISFYVFKTVSYLIDVYRGDLEAERDFLRYALYVSFFPEILSGPISRAPSMLPQFNEVHTFDYVRIRDGLFRMLWGYFVKLVIASRLAIPVDLIFGNTDAATGIELFIASVLYSLQIYCDFMSYSEIAIGAAKVLGIETAENFKQPFFADTLSGLWRRWHMSLMTWFKDYLYIPLGGSRKGVFRKYLNILIVFTLSGFWHGAAFHYILWGFLSGLLQVLGEMTRAPRKAVSDAVPFKGPAASCLHSVYSRVATFLLFTFTVIFFRSPDVKTALLVIEKIFTSSGAAALSSFNPFNLGLGTFNLLITLFLLLMLFLMDLLKERSGESVSVITGMNVYIRWAVYFFLSCSIILSANIGAQKFIYFEF